MRTALGEAVKELLRVVVLSVLPIVIDSLSIGEVNLRLILVTGAIAGLRFLDKLLHEREVEKPEGEQNKGLLGVKGITGF